jgi:hypothetical protein
MKLTERPRNLSKVNAVEKRAAERRATWIGFVAHSFAITEDVSEPAAVGGSLAAKR